MQASCLILWSEASISLALYNEAGEREEIWYQISLDDIARHTKNRSIVVGLLSPEISFMQANLPSLSERALRKALPYALEDECIDEVDHLHFAFSESETGSPQNIAVVSKDFLKSILALFQSAQIEPDVLVPACLLLTLEASTWTLSSHQAMVFVRVNKTAGFVCDVNNIVFALNQAMKIYGEPSKIVAKSTHAFALNTVLVECSVVSDVVCVDTFLSEIYHFPALNLLQGEFRVKKKQPQQEHRLLKMLRVGVYAWIGLSIVVPLISWMMLSMRINSLESNINTIYARYVPEANNATMASHLFDAKWRAASNSAKDGDFLRLLAVLGQANHSVTGVTIHQLSFDGRGLRLLVSAQSSSQFSTWSDTLTNAGLVIQQTSADLEGERLHATVLIH